MSIRKNVIRRVDVVDANDIVMADVRGLAFADINNLVSMHFDNLDKLLTVWDHYKEISKRQDAGSVMTDADFANMIVNICQMAPGIICDVIALAADEDDPEALKEISRWPMHAQARAIQAIYALTVQDFGGPAKLIGVLIAQVRAAAPKLGMMQA